MWITHVSIRNPVFATMVMVAITVLGVFSYTRLPVEQMPDTNLPFVLILTNYPGAAPEAVETDITKPIEYAVNQVSGVKLIRSNSLEGQSTVFVEFRLATDTSRAMQDVRDKIATVRPAFPKDAKDPLVIRADNENNQPVISLAVMSPTTGLRELTSITDQTIVKALENLPGVARLDVNGRVTRQILIQIKPHALAALGIGVDQVMNAIRQSHQDVPAGRITRGQSDSVVRIEGKIKDPMQFGRIIVAQQGSAPVFLSQVADIIDGEKDKDSISRINGRAAITIDIQKAQDANIVETGKNVRAAVAALKGRLPPDVEVRVTYSSADSVEKSINRVKETIIEGALLTVLIVFLFLHSWRSTIITGLDAADCGDRHLHRALRVRLHAQLHDADGAVAVHRLADRRCHRGAREHRASPAHGQETICTAARDGTDEIGLAVMATTFAIVAVFVPVAFMPGIIGKFFFPFGADGHGGGADRRCSSASRSTRCCRRAGSTRRSRAMRAQCAPIRIVLDFVERMCWRRTRCYRPRLAGRCNIGARPCLIALRAVLRQLCPVPAGAGGQRIHPRCGRKLSSAAPQHAGRLQP